MRGKIYLVGAGPGSPDLITVRGLEILRQAEVIIYDYLVDRRLLEEARPEAQLFCCDKLSERRHADGFIKSNEKIDQLMVKKFRQGKKVIRLKNGDVSLFSRVSQELEALIKAKIEFEIVPGVTAAAAASAFTGIPLTDRKLASSCVFVTGHQASGKKESFLNWESLAKSGTIVLYMAVENLSRISRQLLMAGKDPATPVAVIQRAGLLTQKVSVGRLKDIAKNEISPPAIVIVGDTVKFEKSFNWLKKTKRILFTGLSEKRFFDRGMIFHLPVIRIEPLTDYRRFDRELKNIGRFDWLVFASRYGAEYFFKRLEKIGRDCRSLRRAKIAAIGRSTADSLLKHGIRADLLPQVESSLGLLKSLKKIDLRYKTIFIPRSDLGDKGLTEALISQGAEVTARVAYKNIMPVDLPDLDLRYFDEVIFTSPSGVKNFHKRYGKIPRPVKVSCIGEVTRREWEKTNDR